MFKKHLLSVFFTILVLISSDSNLKAQSENVSLLVFPNPMLDKATIEINLDQVRPTEFIIYNIIGKEVYRQKLLGVGYHSKFEIDFSFLNPGIYFLSLLSNSEQLATKKIVKKR